MHIILIRKFKIYLKGKIIQSLIGPNGTFTNIIIISIPDYTTVYVEVELILLMLNYSIRYRKLIIISILIVF